MPNDIPPEIESYLRLIAYNTARTEDTSYQFPQPDEREFELAAGSTYIREYSVQQKLLRLTISIPTGVICYIYKNGVKWRRYTGIFTYDDLIHGEHFDRFKIVVQNTNTAPVTWSVTAVFV